MNCTQDTVREILARARASSFGLDSPEKPINMGNYAGATTETLAMALVGGFHAKYDLISVMWAALDVAYEQGCKSNAPTAPRLDALGASAGSAFSVYCQWLEEPGVHLLKLCSEATFDAVILARAFKQPNAMPSHRWRWTCMGSTTHAATLALAKQGAEYRLTHPSHESWQASLDKPNDQAQGPAAQDALDELSDSENT